MNKKIFIGLFVISLIVFAGGCGGSSNSVTTTTDVNAVLSGAWSSSSNGTATITGVKYDEVSALIEAFGELPGSVLEELKNDSPDLYELYESMNQGTSDTSMLP